MSKKSEIVISEAMFYILLALTEPLHGYKTMEKVTEISNGRVEIGPGTLYGIIKRLQKDRWIELVSNDGRRKTYQLTELGKRRLKEEHSRFIRIVKDGEKVLGEGGW